MIRLVGISMQKTAKIIAHAARSRKRSGTPAGTTFETDLIALAAASTAHKWLEDPAEDIYSLNDGRAASWPKRI